MSELDKVYEACRDGKLSIITNMFINGYVFEQSALETAAEFGQFEIVQYLIETCGLKALANNRKAFKLATDNVNAKIFYYLQKKSFEEINTKSIMPSTPKNTTSKQLPDSITKFD